MRVVLPPSAVVIAMRNDTSGIDTAPEKAGVLRLWSLITCVALINKVVRRNKRIVRRPEIVSEIAITIRSVVAIAIAFLTGRQRCPSDMIARLTP